MPKQRTNTVKVLSRGFGHPKCLNNPPIDPNTKTAAGGIAAVE